MTSRWLLAVAFICSATPFASAGAGGPASGCWSIEDQIERLACFDMAVGPPAPSSPSKVAGAKSCDAAAHSDCLPPKPNEPSR